MYVSGPVSNSDSNYNIVLVYTVLTWYFFLNKICIESSSKMSGFCSSNKKTSFKAPLTFVPKLITETPALEQSFSQQYVVWLTSYGK